MEKGQGKGTDTLQTDKVFTRKEYIEREAAKKVICDYCSCVQLCIRNENDCWAIEALQAIPAVDVVVRDCYDRLLAENDDIRAIVDTYGGLENIQSAFEKLHEIETADVVPVRHGKWIEQPHDFDLCGVAYYQCSVCGKEQQTPSNYCQFCGAGMDGDGE